MSDQVGDSSWQDRPDAGRPNRGSLGEGSIESYEDEEAVVFFDAENPLAWVETTRTVQVRDHA